MTNREFYNLIATNETLTDEIRAHAEEQISKLDAIAETILGTEAKTATDVAAVLTAEAGEEVKVQKASYLLRLAVELGLANATEVKIPKKGQQKAYTVIAQ